MNFGGSQTVCSGIKIGVSVSTELDFFGVTVKGYQVSLPRIAADMAVYIYYHNVLFDPFSVYYSIFDTSGNPVKYQQHVLASRFDTGWYYANFGWWNQPLLNNLKNGTYRIVWEVQQTQFDTASSKADEFSVYKSKNEICSTSSDISSGGSAGAISSTQKQSGTCNTFNYGVGLVIRSVTGCGC
jgi:hypothetical protein